MLPSVTYNLDKVDRADLFSEDYNALALDWHAWIKLAKMDGRFCYIKKIIMSHRIHQRSETTEGINSGQRYKDDLRIFSSLWPKWIAKILANYTPQVIDQMAEDKSNRS